MSANGKLVLSWNDFTVHSSTTLTNLWEDKTFTDVTLATKDESEIRVHKAILCSFSMYFRKSLMANTENNLFFLESVDFQSLENILKFAYIGKCELDDSELEGFLNTAKYLEVIFLSEDVTVTPKCQSTSKKEIYEIENKGKKQKYSFECDQCNKKYLRKSHLQEHKQSNHVKIKGYECGQCEYKSYRKTDVNKHIQSKHQGVFYKCDVKECDYETSFKSNIKVHNSTKHEGLLYLCYICQHVCTSKSRLHWHTKMEHTGITYNCDKCDYNAGQRKKIDEHKRNQHNEHTYSCHECDFGTSIKEHLMHHKKLHTYINFKSKTHTELISHTNAQHQRSSVIVENRF